MEIPIWVDDLVCLFFPRLCLICTKSLSRGLDTICVHCQYKLPKTNFHQMIENPITHKFWGRSNIQYATAFYFYDKDTSRILIHELKYNDRPDIGEKIGHLYGKILKSTHFDEIDCIIPVPLHPKKKKLRGYNQSEAFANGLGEAMNKDVVGGLERGIFTETQTKKGKMERFENMENVFVVTNKTALEGRHLLLVDDVLTTGATLDQCAEELLLIDGVKVSIATIATGKFNF